MKLTLAVLLAVGLTVVSAASVSRDEDIFAGMMKSLNGMQLRGGDSDSDEEGGDMGDNDRGEKRMVSHLYMFLSMVDEHFLSKTEAERKAMITQLQTFLAGVKAKVIGAMDQAAGILNNATGFKDVEEEEWKIIFTVAHQIFKAHPGEEFCAYAGAKFFAKAFIQNQSPALGGNECKNLPKLVAGTVQQIMKGGAKDVITKESFHDETVKEFAKDMKCLRAGVARYFASNDALGTALGGTDKMAVYSALQAMISERCQRIEDAHVIREIVMFMIVANKRAGGGRPRPTGRPQQVRREMLLKTLEEFLEKQLH